MKKKKIKCCICNSVIMPGNNPYTGVPNGVGLQIASGKTYNVCSRCVSYRNDEVNAFVMAEEAKARVKTEEFPYRIYKDGEEPPVYCLRCGRQLTKIDKDGVNGKSHPYIVLMIDPANLNGHYGLAAMCDECSKEALQDGGIIVKE